MFNMIFRLMKSHTPPNDDQSVDPTKQLLWASVFKDTRLELGLRFLLGIRLGLGSGF